MASGAQRNPAAGFALVDALVALLIFSIGIWALANSQQAQMQRAERQLQSRIAWSLLDNLAQRLRLHTTRFGTESMQANYHLDGVAPGVRGAALPALAACHAVACDALAFAQFNIADWQHRLQQASPFASGHITLRDGWLLLVVAWPSEGHRPQTALNHRACNRRHACAWLWL